MNKVEAVIEGHKIQIEYYSSVLSTNTLLKQEGPNDRGTIRVAIADAQSGGRGRLGKSYYCPCRSGLYMSFRLDNELLRPDQHLTVVTSVAVARAIREVFDIECDVKWVNDIYHIGKKVCGILCEGVCENGIIKSAVVGIGVNIAEPEGGYPKNILNVAGALCEKYTDEIRDKLAYQVLKNFFAVLELDHESLYAEYSKRLFIIGKKVTCIRNNVEIEAIVSGLASDFSLLISHDGKVESLHSGDVTLKI